MSGFFYALLLAAAPMAECHVRAIDLTPVTLARFEQRGKPQWLDFSREAACLVLQDTTAATVLVDLAGLSAPARIDIEARSVGSDMLAVEALTLDAEGEVIVHRRFADFSTRGDLYRLSLFVNDAAMVPRYLLLKPDAEWLMRTDHRVRSQHHVVVMLIGMGAVGFNHGTERETTVSYGAKGKFHVQIHRPE